MDGGHPDRVARRLLGRRLSPRGLVPADQRSVDCRDHERLQSPRWHRRAGGRCGPVRDDGDARCGDHLAPGDVGLDSRRDRRGNGRVSPIQLQPGIDLSWRFRQPVSRLHPFRAGDSILTERRRPSRWPSRSCRWESGPRHDGRRLPAPGLWQAAISGDRRHIHHMLLDRGLSVRQVAMGTYAVCGALALVSLLVASPAAFWWGPCSSSSASASASLFSSSGFRSCGAQPPRRCGASAVNDRCWHARPSSRRC